jgi:hypothetical protein
MRSALEVALELEEAFVGGKPARDIFVLISELRNILLKEQTK